MDGGVLRVSALLLNLHGQVDGGVALDQPAEGDDVDAGDAVALQVVLRDAPAGLDDDVWELLLQLPRRPGQRLQTKRLC